MNDDIPNDFRSSADENAWTPRKQLMEALEAYLSGDRASHEETQWGELLRVLQGEDVADGDDIEVRAVLERHAMLIVLTRAGVDGLTPMAAQRLAGRFRFPEELLRASDEALRLLVPSLADVTLVRLRHALSRSRSVRRRKGTRRR